MQVQSCNLPKKCGRKYLCLEKTMSKAKRIIIPVLTILAIFFLIRQKQSYESPSLHNLHLRKIINNDIKDLMNCPINNFESNINHMTLSQSLNFSIDEFYTTDLTKYPEQANKLSNVLTNWTDVIFEAQRVHMNIFSKLLKGYKYAMLFDYSPSENKGDSAIVVGEMKLLRKLNIDIVFACPVRKCETNLDAAEKISVKYTNNELVILFHGGGNVIGYHSIDEMRFREISRFQKFNIIMFPQGLLYRGKEEHIELCKNVYSSHPNMTFIWRDTTSYILGKKLFPNVQSLLSPDIAFQIGPVKRFMDPTYDILWIKRDDSEMPGYNVPGIEGNYRMHVADWKMWTSPKGTSPMESSYLMTTTGMMFLSRGKVVVTDRLHGVILCTLLNIPHVYIDNKQKKISNYHKSWMLGLENTLLSNSSQEAIIKAKNLLKKLENVLPNVSGFYRNTGN